MIKAPQYRVVQYNFKTPVRHYYYNIQIKFWFCPFWLNEDSWDDKELAIVIAKGRQDRAIELMRIKRKEIVWPENNIDN